MFALCCVCGSTETRHISKHIFAILDVFFEFTVLAAVKIITCFHTLATGTSASTAVLN